MLHRFKCDPEILIQAIAGFGKIKILVFGDLMLDRFIWGSVSRISPEAPVPVVEIKRENTLLGGAANVSMNIRSLGGIPIPVGVVGNDVEGEQLRDEFQKAGAPVAGVIIDKERPTSVKTRIIAHHQQVCRTDREDRSPLAPAIQSKIIEKFVDALATANAVIISDYAKGLISPAILKKTLPRARAAKKIVCIDPKMADLSCYKPATVITPNTTEAERASGIHIANDADLERAGKKILAESGIQHVLITRGEEGMTLFGNGEKVAHIPTVAKEIYDVTGAGDTVISTLALGLVAGLSILESAVLSNIAAGIVVGKLGTASVSPEELIESIREIRGQSA